jgi:hypothetical protein
VTVHRVSFETGEEGGARQTIANASGRVRSSERNSALYIAMGLC